MHSDHAQACACIAMLKCQCHAMEWCSLLRSFFISISSKDFGTMFTRQVMRLLSVFMRIENVRSKDLLK